MWTIDRCFLCALFRIKYGRYQEINFTYFILQICRLADGEEESRRAYWHGNDRAPPPVVLQITILDLIGGVCKTSPSLFFLAIKFVTYFKSIFHRFVSFFIFPLHLAGGLRRKTTVQQHFVLRMSINALCIVARQLTQVSASISILPLVSGV